MKKPPLYNPFIGINEISQEKMIAWNKEIAWLFFNILNIPLDFNCEIA
jgi:hypothetical protein